MECSIPRSITELWGALRVSSGPENSRLSKPQKDLSAAILESDGVSVGKDKSSLSVVEKELNNVDVCAAFGLFVKFSASLDEPGGSSILDVSKNASEVMMQAFFDHCCQIRHYSFYLKKCGYSECEICKPVRMDNERFINFLPDPVMGSDNHYVPFADVYGTDTSDNKRPSLTQRRKMKTHKRGKSNSRRG